MPLSVICLQYTTNLFQFEFSSHALVCDFVFQKELPVFFIAQYQLKNLLEAFDQLGCWFSINLGISY